MTANITSETLQSSQPDTTSTISLPGLKSDAAIYRDKHGIPHGRAASTWDAFFLQGFYTAQDRLFQMDYDRRRAYGRVAELVGPAALAQDKLMRSFRLEASAQADLQVVSESARRMLEAYAAGVNAFIETTSTLPIEYQILEASPESWRPHDSLGVFKIRHILMGVFEQKLWRAKLLRQVGAEKMAALCPGYQQGQLVIVPPGKEYEGAVDGVADLLREAETWMQPMETIEVGSNNWVLAGPRTASGAPILAGDPHRALDTPNVYYQNHVACPDFDVIGLPSPVSRASPISDITTVWHGASPTPGRTTKTSTWSACAPARPQPTSSTASGSPWNSTTRPSKYVASPPCKSTSRSPTTAPLSVAAWRRVWASPSATPPPVKPNLGPTLS